MSTDIQRLKYLAELKADIMLETKLKCPVCGLKGSTKSNHIFESKGEQDGYPMIECAKCGSRIVFSSPLLIRIAGLLIVASIAFALIIFPNALKVTDPVIIALIGLALVIIRTKPRNIQVLTKEEVLVSH